MNFGQALSSLLNGKNITCPELNRPGAFLAVQPPTGNITQSFICEMTGAGVCTPWVPTQAAILSSGWTHVQERGAVTQEQREHAHAGV